MKMNLDKKADALYITFKKGKFAKNKRIDADTIADYDSKGNLLGLEILNISLNISKRSRHMGNVRIETVN